MKSIVFSLALLALSASAQTIKNPEIKYHREPDKLFNSMLNQSLRKTGVFATCTISRTGNYKAENGFGYPPILWSAVCVKETRISWEPTDVNGVLAVSYRVGYYSHSGNLETVTTEEYAVRVPIAELSAYTIFVEAYDALGNSEFITYMVE